MLGKQIRLRRVELGLSVGDLAERVGVSSRSVCRWERGSGLISAVRVRDICRLFECEVTTMGDNPCSWLRNERYKMGLTQANVADALGIDHRAVSRWETGHDRLTSFVIVRRLCEALDWGIEDLVGEVDGCRGKSEPFATLEDVKAHLLREFY